jgi:phospholipid/cholesterol/gamma-HCH transport system ATP-binding protein
MATDSEPIIRVEDLTVAYGDFVVMKDINFEVQPGEVFIILGGSGCGKSTLLRNMISLVTPVTGKVLINGRNAQQNWSDVSKWSTLRLDEPARKHLPGP